MNVRRAALEIEDAGLLAKLVSRDIIAPQVKYYSNRLWTLYNKAKQAASQDEHKEEAQLHSNAFIELAAFMEQEKIYKKEAMIVPWYSN